MFESSSYHARELTAEEVPRLQALFEANPEYFLAVNGRRANRDEAQAEYDEFPPPPLAFGRRWFAGLFDRNDKLVGVAIVVADFCAPQVWHIALFLVATHLHGQGIGSQIFVALESWMQRSGANWLRLGVVEGHASAERFWARHGFHEVRIRSGLDTGGRINNIRVMIKPLAGEEIAEYLAYVPRDQPDSQLP